MIEKLDTLEIINRYGAAKIYTTEKVLLGKAQAAGKFGDKKISLKIDDNIMDGLNTSFIIILENDAYGLITYRAVLTEFRKAPEVDNMYEVKCELMETLEIIQRRESFKFKVSIPVIIALYDSSKSPIFDNASRTHIKIPVLVKDISASGILIITKEELQVGNIIDFVFEEAKEPFLIEAEILRSQDYGEGDIGYGCRFINLDADKDMKINRYIFESQFKKK